VVLVLTLEMSLEMSLDTAGAGDAVSWLLKTPLRDVC
jgi:hypothetical protein